MPQRDVLVLGAGLAGLSTGIHLLEAGQGRFRVRLLDRGHVIGGKASSMPHKDRATGRTFTVDHGFHVFFDYSNLGARLEALGATDGLSRRHHEVLIWSDGRVRRFRALRLPSPLHLLSGGLESGLFGPLDGMRIFKLMVEIFVIEIDRLSAEELRRLDEISFQEYARARGLSDEVLGSSFFRFITQSAFIFPRSMSALSAIAAIQLVAQNYDAVAIRYMDIGTSEALVEPLVRHFLRLGGTLDKFRRAERIEIAGGAVDAVTVADNRHFIHKAETGTWRSNYHSLEHAAADAGHGEEHGEEHEEHEEHEERAHAAMGGGGSEPVRADWYVSALPPRDLVAALAPESLALPYFANLTRLETQRTIALQLWLDRVVSPPDADGAVVGLPGPFSTVCDLFRVQRRPEGRGSVVQFVGEDGAYAALPDEKIVDDALAVLHDLWPDARAAVVERRYFHRGRHDDFFLTTPGSDALRPPAASPHRNLILAGDYTQTGFRVICMEGAFISGMRAANELLAREGLPPVAVLPMREPGGAIGVLRRLRRAAGGLGGP